MLRVSYFIVVLSGTVVSPSVVLPSVVAPVLLKMQLCLTRELRILRNDFLIALGEGNPKFYFDNKANKKFILFVTNDVTEHL